MNASPTSPRRSPPLVAAAIHDGHVLSSNVAQFMKLSPLERLREEDPYTARWTSFTPWRVIGDRSRFEVDLNRPPELAVYQLPEHCWGLDVWKEPLPQEIVQQSLQRHARFYEDLHELLADLISQHGMIVVYDLHTYNHRRNGPDGELAPAAENPEINVGTGTMDREFWSPVVNRFIEECRAQKYQGRFLDVRENVKFKGGYFSKWIHENFPQQAVSLAIEVKKFFMDEWTGEADCAQIDAIGKLLSDTTDGVVSELDQLEVSAS